MNSPLNDAKAGASTLAACGYDRAGKDARREYVRVGKRAGLAAYSTRDPQARRISPR